MEELSALEKDTISEVGNISLGASATALSAILDRPVDITTPKLQVLAGSDINLKYPVPCLVVEVQYTSGLEGSNMLLIKEQDAVAIAALMMGEPVEGKEGPLNEIELSAVQEAMNQMMGSMATSMSVLFQRPIEISPPQIELVSLGSGESERTKLDDDAYYVHVEFSIIVEGIIDSVMVQVAPIVFAKQMAGYLLTGESGTAPASEDESAAGAEAVPESLDHLQTAPSDEAAAADSAILDPAEGVAALNDMEIDTIKEVGNISLGASATALSNLLDKAVDITTPQLEIIRAGDIKDKYPVPCLLVEVDYTLGLKGTNMLLVKERDAITIAAVMMGEDPGVKEGPLNEIEMSAVQEAMNQMMGAMATSMSELFQRTIDISPPTLEMIDLGEDRTVIGTIAPEQEVAHVVFSIKVEDLIDSVMIQIIPIEFAREMTDYLLHGQVEQVAETVTESVPDPDPGLDSMTELVEEYYPVPDLPAEPPPEPAAPRGGATRRVGDLDVDLQKLEMVKDIPMDITVVLGTAKLPLGKLFALDKGGLVSLDCSAGDPVELLANEKLLAKGEVVMINDQLGVRILEIQFEEIIESYKL